MSSNKGSSRSRKGHRRAVSRKISHSAVSSRILFSVLVLGVAGFIDLMLLPDGSEYKVRNPSSTALIDARENASSRADITPVGLRFTPLHKISPNLRRAVVISEDANFFSHSGFDWGEIRSALMQAIEQFSLPRGASTITQQLAKNLYLSESRNPWRKMREAVITIELERHLSKERILELYLNVIEWGDHIYGAEAAAQHYFKRSAQSLSDDQASFLAAIIPNPRVTYNPTLHPKRVERRSLLILKRLRRQY